MITSSTYLIFDDPFLLVAFWTDAKIEELQALLKSHYNAFVTAYGETEVTINQHKILHLPEHIRLFGPPAAFSVRS